MSVVQRRAVWLGHSTGAAWNKSSARNVRHACLPVRTWACRKVHVRGARQASISINLAQRIAGATPFFSKLEQCVARSEQGEKAAHLRSVVSKLARTVGDTTGGGARK